MILAGLVLAGGQSRRMGQEKALLLLGGEALAARAVRRLAQQVSGVALSWNGGPAAGLPDGPLLADPPQTAGPLAGILAGLLWAGRRQPRPEALLSVAVDCPFFPDTLAARLGAAAARNPGAIAVASSLRRTHPTCALWPLTVAPALAAFLAGGGRSCHGFLGTARAVAVAFPAVDGLDPFLNLNTADELAAARRHLESRQLPDPSPDP